MELGNPHPCFLRQCLEELNIRTACTGDRKRKQLHIGSAVLQMPMLYQTAILQSGNPDGLSLDFPTGCRCTCYKHVTSPHDDRKPNLQSLMIQKHYKKIETQNDKKTASVIPCAWQPKNKVQPMKYNRTKHNKP